MLILKERQRGMNTLEVEQQVFNTKKELYTTTHVEHVKLRMTQQELGEQVGVTCLTIRNLEKKGCSVFVTCL